MALKPYHEIAGEPPRPQLVLKGRDGREYGVVEYYETDRARPYTHVLLEFFPSDSPEGPRPRIWVDLAAWSVAIGHGKNLPDPDFEPSLDAYLKTFPEEEKELRRERARKAIRFDLMRLAEQGYSIAYQEMFPGELTREDFPRVWVDKTQYVVDDQYLIRPGDYRNQMTLVFVPEGADKSGGEVEPAMLANWLFGEGYEILESQLEEMRARRVLDQMTSNPELERIYRERLARMRREGVLLGIKPKPYAARGSEETESP
ncbi:MAG: hypothetical protein JF616_04310 [Fibrobacteres bacterium]|nr:hypothetical protein [Fibrobacterota bacterium]